MDPYNLSVHIFTYYYTITEEKSTYSNYTTLILYYMDMGRLGSVTIFRGLLDPSEAKFSGVHQAKLELL